MANIEVKVRINAFDGSLFAPDAKYDAILYYSSANSNRFSTALGIYGALADDAAYFARKSVGMFIKGLMFYDCKNKTYPRVFPDPRNNNSTVIYGGQFNTKDEVGIFMTMLKSGCENLDLNNSVKLSFEGNADILIERKERDKAWNLLITQ